MIGRENDGPIKWTRWDFGHVRFPMENTNIVDSEASAVGA
jgi:hypothetical protein